MARIWDRKIRYCTNAYRVGFCARVALTKTYEGDINFTFLQAMIRRVDSGRHVKYIERFGVEKLYFSYIMSERMSPWA